MKNSQYHYALMVASGIASLLVAIPASSQLDGSTEISGWTIDGGGGRSTGENLVVAGTFGQHDAGLQPLSGGRYRVSGGFLSNAGDKPNADVFFSDSFEQE